MGGDRYTEPYENPQGGTVLSQWEQSEAQRQNGNGTGRSRAGYGVSGTLVDQIPGNQTGGQTGQQPADASTNPARQGNGTVAGDLGGTGSSTSSTPVDARDYRTPTYETYTPPKKASMVFAGGVGTYLAEGPGGKLLNTAAERVLDSSKPIGNSLINEGSIIGKTIGENGIKSAKPVIDALNKAQTGPLAKGAEAWKAHYTPKVAAAAENTAAAAESTAGTSAAANVAKGAGAEGALGTAKDILSKPGVRSLLKGGAVVAGTLAADHVLPGPKDDYHLSTLGVPLAIVAGRGNLGSMAWMAGGSLVAGKALNYMLPAEDHPHLANIMKPGFVDTALVTGSAFLPLDTKGKIAAMTGSWVFGRMTNMSTGESALAGAGLAGLTYKMTRNPALSIGVGAGSWALSRVF